MVRIIVVRHGESLGNAHHLFLGHTDMDLSEHGYRQARALADYLKKEEKIDKIYSSDLLRAYNTVKTYADGVGMEVIRSENLREIYAGDFEGREFEELAVSYGDFFTVEWVKNFGTFKLPNGESIIEAGERFKREVVRIASENEGKTLLIGAHAAVIRSFWGIISGIAPDELAEKLPHPSNASCNYCVYDGERLVPERYSVDFYLEKVGVTKLNM